MLGAVARHAAVPRGAIARKRSPRAHLLHRWSTNVLRRSRGPTASSFGPFAVIGVEATLMTIGSSLSPDAKYDKVMKGIPESFRVFYNKRGRFAVRAPQVQQQL